MNALVRCPQCGRETPAAGAPGMAPRCRYCTATLYGAKPVGPAPQAGKANAKLVGGLIAGGVLLVGGCLCAGVLGAVALFLGGGGAAAVPGPDDVIAAVPGADDVLEKKSRKPVTVDAPVPELPPQKQSLGDAPGAGEFDPATAVIPFDEPVEDPNYLAQPDWNVPLDPYVGEDATYVEQPIPSKSDPLLASLNGPFVVIDMPPTAARGPSAGLSAEEADAPPAKLIDLRSGEAVGTFTPQAPAWRNGRLSPDGKWLVGPDTAPDATKTLDEGKLFIWQPDKTEPTTTIELTGMLFWMDFVADDRFATASVDEELALVPTIGRPGENVVVAISRTPRFRVWNVATGEKVLDATLPEDALAYRRTEIWKPETMAQKGLLPDGKTETMREYFWETEGVEALEKSQPLRRLAFQPRRGYGAVSPGRNQVALLGRHQVTLVSVADGKVLGRLPLSVNRTRYDARGLSFSPDGKLLYGVIDERDRGMIESGDGAAEKRRLVTWSLVDGRRISDPQIYAAELVGRPLPAPYPGTVLLTEVDPNTTWRMDQAEKGNFHDNVIRYQNGIQAAGGIVTLPWGGVADPLGYMALGWLPPNRVLISYPGYELRDLRVVEIDHLALQHAAGRPSPEKGPIQNGHVVARPEVVEPDRSAAKTIAVPASPPAWRAAAAGPLPTLPLLPTMRAWPDAFADGQYAVIAYDKRPVELPDDPQLAKYANVTEVARPVWHRYDAATGQEIGEPIELWPSGTPGPDRQKATTSLTALTPSGDRLAFVDPQDGARVDVWDAEGKRLVGFRPFGEYEHLQWIGWAGDKLWTLRRGKLIAWEIPSCKAVCEIDGGYQAPVHLPPGRTFLAAQTRKHVDLIDASTGEIVGRCEDPEHDDFRMTALSPDGKRLLRVRLIPRAGAYPDGEAHLWDLATGKKERPVVVPTGTPSGKKAVNEAETMFSSTGGILQAVHWIGERRLLGQSAYCHVVDLDLEGSAIYFQSPFYAEKPSTAVTTERPPNPGLSVDPYGRLWHRRQIDPSGGDLATNWEWRSLVAPNLDDPAAAEAFAPDREIAFNRSSTVRVEVDLGLEEENRALAERVAGLLQQEGFTIGPGSWAVNVSHRIVGDETGADPQAFVVPTVEVIWKLIAPDGAVVTEFVEVRGWSGKPGEGALADVASMVFDREEFDFEPDRRRAFADIILGEPEVVDRRTLSHELPRSVVKSNGKLMPLPIESTFTAP